MTEIPISPEIWKLAGELLTQKQMTVLTLRERHGYSWNMLAINFNCTRSNVREIHRAATKNMLDAINAADGDIDLALARARGDEATPEQEREFDRLWVESAQPRLDSEEEADDTDIRERDAGGSGDLQARPEAGRRGGAEDHRPELQADGEGRRIHAPADA